MHFDTEPNEPIVILLVEDSPGYVRLTQEGFRAVNRNVTFHVAADGVEAMEFLKRKGVHTDAPRPDLILLDLNLPLMHGRDVLEKIKMDDELKTIPTLVLTTSDEPDEVLDAYERQANCFIAKPVQLGELERVISSINEFWLNIAKRPKLL